MEEKDKKENVTKVAKKVLNLMSVSYDSVDVSSGEKRTIISIYSKKDSKILIGKYGANLLSLTLILNIIIKKKIDNNLQIFVDVNDYHKENLDVIKNKALMVAERVKSFQVDMELDPMNAFERRFVHSLFDENSGVITQSKGSGNERRIVVSVKKEGVEEDSHQKLSSW